MAQFPTAAHMAAWAGIAPPMHESAGKRGDREHRQANAALYRVVIGRMQHHGPTRAYVARATTEGKTNTEIICRRKRLIARELLAAMRILATPRQPLPGPLDTFRSLIRGGGGGRWREGPPVLQPAEPQIAQGGPWRFAVVAIRLG